MKIGTRASALALAQAGMVAELLGDAELIPVITSGDRDRRSPSSSPSPSGMMDKERWVKELELALLDGEIDIAVHSAKDVPSVLPDGLEIVGAPLRAAPYDALVGAGSLDELPEGARVGTSSLRRAAQLRALRADLDVSPIHGNVDTRLRRLEEGAFDALVLAAAGLVRLDRPNAIDALLFELIPAPGQGTLALEARAGDTAAREAARAITDDAAWASLSAERALVAHLNASCNTPLGAHALVREDGIAMQTFVGLPDGSAWFRDDAPAATTPEEAAQIAAERLLAAGGGELLRLAEEAAA